MGGKFKFHLKKVKLHTWQLVLILVPLLFLAATFLRFDHIKMTELRTAVLEADAAGDEEKIASSLEELANFTKNNIVINIVDDNGSQKIFFGTGPFYLEQSYLRAADKAISDAKAKIENGENPNGAVIVNATNFCNAEAAAHSWAWGQYLSCVTSEINKYPAAEDLTAEITADIPSTELFRKEFSSPVWTFSLSGITILLCLILTVVIFIRFFIWVIIRLSLLFA